MRIIGGRAKSLRLSFPKSTRVRPALDQVKESLFNILGPCDGKTVLDLFAGSGSIGLEAASRGAKNVLLVDNFVESIKIIQKNILHCQLENNCEVLKAKLPQALKFIKKKYDSFDLIFIDPPYDKNLINPSLEKVHENKLIDADGLIILEHSPREIPSHDKFDMFDQRQYGQTWVSFLKYQP